MCVLREGHTSLVKELERDLRQKPGAVVLSVGGGGLLNGVVEGLRRANWADVPVVAMETIGAHSLNAAVKAGKLVTLPAITRYLITHVVTHKQCHVCGCDSFLTFYVTLQCCDHSGRDACLCSDHEAGAGAPSVLRSRLGPRRCKSCGAICRLVRPT